MATPSGPGRSSTEDADMLIRALVLSIFFLAAAAGQSISSAQISGTIRDPAGLPVTGASVRITNTDTGDIRTTHSEEDGFFAASNLPAGQYRVEVVAAGFSTYSRSNLALAVSQNPKLEITLSIGEAAEQITVDQKIPMVESRSVSVGQVIDGSRILDLPLNGRQASQLVVLAGAAVANAPMGTRQYPSIAGFSVAGGQRTGTYFTLDGGSHMDTDASVGLPMPFPDALREFKVDTSALAANYGTHPGGVVNVVTKSGANSFHGGLFEFVRNYGMNARNYFAPARDSLKRNQFGGVLGGPIRRDSVFFFVGYQGTWTRTDPATSTAYVPTAAVFAGDFGPILSPACNSGRQITLKAPFAGNQINPTQFNPVALKLVSLIPVSNDPCGKIQYGIASNSREHQSIARTDWQHRRHTTFGRWFMADYQVPPNYTNNLLTANTVGVSDRVQAAAAGDTWAVSASAVNTVRAVFTRSIVVRVPSDKVPTLTDLGANVYSPIPNFTGTISVSGYFSSGGLPGYYANNTFQISDDFEWVRGAHQFAAGFNWLHTQLNAQGPFQQNPRFTFNGTITGNALTDFLLGLPASMLQGNAQVGYDRMNSPSLYFQDLWRLHPRLTLTAGLRWDPLFPQHNVQNMVSIFDLDKFNRGVHSKVFTNGPAGVLFPGDPDFPGQSNTAGRTAVFSPRLGVLYDPRGQGREVIRAGYGVFREMNYMWMMQHVPLNPPWGETLTLNVPAGGLSNPWQGYPGGNPFPTPVPLPSNSGFPQGGVYVFMPQHVHPTYTQQWNLTVEKQLAKDWRVSASYLGNKTTHLWLSREINPAIYIPGNCAPGQYGLTAAGACSTLANVNQRRVLTLANPAEGGYFGAVAMVDDGANAGYNALLLSVQHRFSRSFSLLTNYTWSHCLDEGDQSNAGDITNFYQDPNNRAAERASCGMDRRHLFNASGIVRTPKLATRPLRIFAGEWQFSGIASASSGGPLNVTTGSDNALRGETSIQDRPNLTSDPAAVTRSIVRWFNTGAFSRAATGSYGNLGRNTIVGPGQFTLDLSAFRTFPVTEQVALEFRADAFNAINHARFANPGVTLSNTTTFGVITSASDARILQLALKLRF